MNKIIIVLLIALVSMSCASVPDSMPPPYALTDINDWIYNNIEWENVGRTVETAQDPSTTLARRTGDCIDMSKLFIEMSNGAVELFGVVIDGKYYHMMVVSKTFGYYDPTHGRAYGWELPEGWVPYKGKY